MQQYKTRLGTKIVLDEEKILQDGIYTLEQIYGYFDILAKKYSLTKEDKFTYMTAGNELDLSMIGCFTHINLLEQKSLFKYIKEWIFIDEKYGNIDMIKKYHINENIDGKY